MFQRIDKRTVAALISDKNKRMRDVPSFLKRTSDLLKEGYTFPEALFMLLPYHAEKAELWGVRIQQQFNSGSSVADILQQFSIPRHFLLLTKIAEEKGGLADTLQYISEQMRFQEDMRKKFIKLLIYPVFLIAILATVFVLFRNYFLPNMQQIAVSADSQRIASLKLAMVLLHFPDFLIGFLILSILLLFSIIHFIRKKDIADQLKIILKTPVANSFYKLNITRQFSRLLGSLLVSGVSLQHALTILEEQKLSPHLSYIASLLRERVIFGDSLSDAVNILQLFTPKFDEFIRHGEKSGYLGREMLIFSDLLNERIHSMLKICLSAIQPFFFILIAICIVAAYLSMLLPVYDLIEIL